MMLIVVLALCGSQDSDGSEARTSTYVQHRRDVKVVANARSFRHRQRRGDRVSVRFESHNKKFFEKKTKDYSLKRKRERRWWGFLARTAWFLT
jgi:hypothetical protein